MAESKFLKWQDKDGDMLPDVCAELVDIPEENVCLDCTPKPSAAVPDWLACTKFAPFLNEQECLYQITIITKYRTILTETLLERDSDNLLTSEEAEAGIEDRFEEYVDEAMEALLEYYNKDTSEESIEALKEVVDYTEYDLDPRPTSLLKLLFSVPFTDLNEIEDAEDEEDEEDEGEETEVSYRISDLKAKLIKIRKGLNLYSRYQKIYMAVEGGGLYVDESTSPYREPPDFTDPTAPTQTKWSPTIFSLAPYGDLGLIGNSIMAKIIPDLDNFLNGKGYNIRGVGFGGGFKDKVVSVEFKFTKEFELKKLTIFTEGCGEKPIIFIKKLSGLKSKPAFKDATAMAYLARLDDMERDLEAREPKPWLEFVKEHTYPPIYSSINAAYSNTDPVNSVGSCIADNLQAEGKQLGQDIMDEVFSIGDAIEYQFHKSLCEASLGKTIEKFGKLGVVYDPNTEESKNWKVMAIEQAFKELEGDDQVFVRFCALIGGLAADGAFPKLGIGKELDDLWTHGFQRVKECGLLGLSVDAIQCLMGGLSLEEALAKIIQTALRTMSIENFGDLFIGLPPEKQTELDALVKKKLESGDIFQASDQGGLAGSGQELSDALAGKVSVNTDTLHIWGDRDKAAKAKEKETTPGFRNNPGMTAAEMQDTSQLQRRTLAQQFDPGSIASTAESELSPNVILEAYALALIQTYSDNLLDLIGELNKFPGAPLIARLLAALDCPRPPILNPSVMDWLKDLELPWCRHRGEVVAPRLENPFGWIPKWADFWNSLFEAIKAAITAALVNILMKIIVKLCQLIGNAMCKALETVGDLAASLPAMATGRTTFQDVVRDSICGDEATQEQIENTVVDMVSSMGVGAAALADTEQALSFAEDVSSASTVNEIYNAFLGDPGEDFLTICDQIIEFEYPEYRSALPNKESIGGFFDNMGNVLPEEFKQEMKNSVNAPSNLNSMPANPTLCATPEQLEDFKDLRCQLLEGRATKEQCDQMFDNMQNKALRDLDTLGQFVQCGVPCHIADNMPPMISDPGCDNGLIPFEEESEIAATTGALSDDLEQLKIDFSYDMLGNGPGMANWGLINMILCDTLGMPFTAHQRKVFGDFGKQNYVDFYVDQEDDEDGAGYAAVGNQKGAYPEKVAEWLETSLQEMSPTFESTNDIQEAIEYAKSFEDFGISSFRGSPQQLLMIPDLGYNVERSEPNLATEQIIFVENARKATPDMTFTYYDNGAGEEDNAFGYGFNIEMYLSDIVEKTEDDEVTYVNRKDDNVRIRIIDEYNVGSAPNPATDYMTKAQSDEASSGTTDDDKIITSEEFEFLAVDDTLNKLFEEFNLDTAQEAKGGSRFRPSYYTEFLNTFEEHQDYLPQIVLLKNLLADSGTDLELSDLKGDYDSFMSGITATFVDAVAQNSASFLYGAKFDDLSTEDIEYVTENGVPYYEATNDEGDPLSNKDQVLGISSMQFDVGEEANRVFYLDPMQYGGNYMNPPLYIKPLANEGWLGFIDIMFPELSPCKPYRTDLVDFGDIDEKISEAYPTIPEDERLKSDPDCVLELPYNRILERPSAAGLQGLIMGAIRIYASVHFIKSLSTFTKFYPKFPETYSSLYASYIVENMEKSFKNAQEAQWLEFFNPFKDEEFWYAFLEQSVQMYARRVDSGEIETPPKTVLEALTELNDKQETYEYADREDLREEKSDGSVSFFKTLKNYRAEKNLEAVQKTEDLAKIVLTELVVEQLQYMGAKFVENLKVAGMSPDIFDLDYYLLTDLTQGGIDLDLNKEIKEEATDFEEGEEQYTAGAELYVKEKNDEDTEFEEGDEYVGYYHAYTDEDGEIVYMSGEFQTEDPDSHDVLAPFAGKVTVPIGDVEEYGYSPSNSITQPFVIEKYISINETKHAPSTAQDYILAQDQSLNMADVFPGTMELVTDETSGEVVGVKGEMGVRYGLLFSIMIGGEKVEITTAEIDALDLPLAQFMPFDGDSKLLLCLINLLKRDHKFRVIAHYIFPLNKITSLIAVYNDYAFLPSIGEVTAAKGASGLDAAAGMKVEIDDYGRAVSALNAEGWANIVDRPGSMLTLFVKTWDEWDKQLLRNSKSRIKKIFKAYYNFRDFTADGKGDEDDMGKLFTSLLRERFKPAAGQRLLPWWKSRMLRTSPFNSKGELCEKED